MKPQVLNFRIALANNKHDAIVANLQKARNACNRACCYDEEKSILLKLKKRLEFLTGCTVVLGC